MAAPALRDASTAAPKIPGLDTATWDALRFVKRCAYVRVGAAGHGGARLRERAERAELLAERSESRAAV